MTDAFEAFVAAVAIVAIATVLCFIGWLIANDVDETATACIAAGQEWKYDDDANVHICVKADG